MHTEVFENVTRRYSFAHNRRANSLHCVVHFNVKYCVGLRILGYKYFKTSAVFLMVDGSIIRPPTIRNPGEVPIR